MIHNTLDLILKSREISVTDAANALDMPRTSLSRFLSSNDWIPNGQTMHKIINTFQVSYGTVLTHVELREDHKEEFLDTIPFEQELILNSAKYFHVLLNPPQIDVDNFHGAKQIIYPLMVENYKKLVSTFGQKYYDTYNIMKIDYYLSGVSIENIRKSFKHILTEPKLTPKDINSWNQVLAEKENYKNSLKKRFGVEYYSC
jgi:hypothetical protein